MQVEQAKCPNCGAGLRVDSGADQATCAYCGTTSFVQHRTSFLQRPLPLPAAARPVMLGLCAGVTNARYTTTTDIYPDSPRATPGPCNVAQVAAVRAAIEFGLATR